LSAALRFDDVTCLRGQRVLFEAMCFALGPGDAALVHGANGAGKSSLLRLAAGLLAPAAGTIVREGRIALADEHPALDRQATLGDALDFWARLDGGDAARGIDALGLSGLDRVPVRMLSTGQRKRATLARVIASGAAIWLLDEPGNGLDTQSFEQLEAAIASHRAGGGIVLVATHQALAISGAMILHLPTPLVSSAVETPMYVSQRPSTALGTNGESA
jgi:heme exporter protein A